MGIVSRLVPTKAHEVFLQGAAEVLRRVPRAHFVVAGDGEPERRAMLEQMAARPPLAGRVHFLGWRSREALREVYADLDLLTTTSDAEGTPVVIIEGMTARAAAKRPSALTRHAAAKPAASVVSTVPRTPPPAL